MLKVSWNTYWITVKIIKKRSNIFQEWFHPIFKSRFSSPQYTSSVKRPGLPDSKTCLKTGEFCHFLVEKITKFTSFTWPSTSAACLEARIFTHGFEREPCNPPVVTRADCMSALLLAACPRAAVATQRSFYSEWLIECSEKCFGVLITL